MILWDQAITTIDFLTKKSLTVTKNRKKADEIKTVYIRKFVSKLNINGIKIHSSDLTNPELLDFVKNTKKSIIISSAGSTLDELENGIHRIKSAQNQIAIMHGYQGYPTKISELNLENIRILKEKFDIPIGVSDHISGDSDLATIIPLIAIAKGATIVEKHITLDRKLKHLDYQSSLNPNEFKKMVLHIRKIEQAIKTNNFELSNNELKYKIQHRKIPITKKSILKNTSLKLEMFEFKRTDKKSSTIPYYDFIGKKSKRKIEKGEILSSSSIENSNQKICAVIACRVGSERLFAKPLQTLGKYSILHLIIKQLKTSKKIDDIILAISENPGNQIFVEFAKHNKLKFLRGDDENVLKRLIDGAKYVNANTILRVTSENPFLYWEGIDDLINKHQEKNNDLTHYAKLPLGSSIEIIKRAALEKSHNQGMKKHRSELCTLYINENPKKFKISRIPAPSSLQKSSLRLTVDTPEDLQVARIIYNRFGKEDNPIKLDKIVRFLEKNSQIQKINSDLVVQHKIF